MSHLPETMRQAQQRRFEGPASIELAEVPLPKLNMAHVLVKMEAAGVNPIDLYTAAGAGPAAATMDPEYRPVVLGWDLAGEVVAVTGEHHDFKVGDKVIAMPRFPYEAATFAEYVMVPVVDIAHAPSKGSVEEHGGLPVVGLTAYQSLFDKAQLREGERVLIHGGAGGVGHVAVQLAVQTGATVFATGSERNRSFIESLGASFIDYKEQDFVSELGATMDVVFDTVGGETFVKSLDVLNEGGRIVTVGGPANFDQAVERGFKPFWNVLTPNAAQLATLAALMDEGKLRVEVSRVLQLEQASEAVAAMGAGGSRGKTVLVP